MPRITWSSLWKVFAGKAMVMNGEKLLWVLWRVSFLISMAQTPAGLKLYSACHDGYEGHGTACLDKQGRARNASLRIKPASMHKCQSHWAEARSGKAPRLLSSVRFCCHPLCLLGSLCSTRVLPTENHTAADKWRLAHSRSLCPNCRQICLHQRQCQCCQHVILHLWVTSESPGAAVSPLRGKSKSHQHCKANPEGQLRHQFACVPSKVSQVLKQKCLATVWRSV